VFFALQSVSYLSYTSLNTKTQDLKDKPKVEGNTMARRNRDDDLLMEEDELTAAFLGDDDLATAQGDDGAQQPIAAATDEWDEDEAQLPGQLAVDVYETKERLVVKARTAGVNKSDLDVSISDNTLTIRGTLSAGTEDNVENYFLQECYWGEFSRSIALPVPVKEEEIEALLKDGVLTISFGKVKQDTVKKIQVL
jgi:HSP20 family protein